MSKIIFFNICLLLCLLVSTEALHRYSHENDIHSHQLAFSVQNVKILDVRNATPPDYRLVNTNEAGNFRTDLLKLLKPGEIVGFEIGYLTGGKPPREAITVGIKNWAIITKKFVVKK